jgi:hypothetical protein
LLKDLLQYAETFASAEQLHELTELTNTLLHSSSSSLTAEAKASTLVDRMVSLLPDSDRGRLWLQARPAAVQRAIRPRHEHHQHQHATGDEVLQQTTTTTSSSLSDMHDDANENGLAVPLPDDETDDDHLPQSAMLRPLLRSALPPPPDPAPVPAVIRKLSLDEYEKLLQDNPLDVASWVEYALFVRYASVVCELLLLLFFFFLFPITTGCFFH